MWNDFQAGYDVSTEWSKCVIEWADKMSYFFDSNNVHKLDTYLLE